MDNINNVVYWVFSMNCYKLRGNEVSASKILKQMICAYKRLLFVNFITQNKVYSVLELFRVSGDRQIAQTQWFPTK
jgi:hypothetical protein